MAKRGKILLCKGTINDNVAQETYKTVLESADYECIILPALKFAFVNLEKLRNCLQLPASFSGLILTSPRSVESIQITTSENPSILEPWQNIPAYCVGPATTTLARNCLKLKNCSGGDSGNSKDLAEFILRNSHVKDAPLLYPCSEIARDTIERVLTDNNISIEKLITYRTITSDTLELDFEKHMRVLPTFIVFFSPSAVDYVLPLLMKRRNCIGHVKLLAIGPVTGEALSQNNVKVDGISEKPEPLALLKAVESCTNSTDA